ncbi:hypothetical protein DENSPDRAFT_848743 [Dentipellis sp. KUC8613]|nr:hypothetical protein DENSPDRAFT_848743 [Dentipellis sp. KUC8613]
MSPTSCHDDAEVLPSELPPLWPVGASVAWDGQAAYNAQVNILPDEPLQHALALLGSRNLPGHKQAHLALLTQGSESLEEDRWTLQPTCGEINDPYNIHPQDIVIDSTWPSDDFDNAYASEDADMLGGPMSQSSTTALEATVRFAAVPSPNPYSDAVAPGSSEYEISTPIPSPSPPPTAAEAPTASSRNAHTTASLPRQTPDPIDTSITSSSLVPAPSTTQQPDTSDRRASVSGCPARGDLQNMRSPHAGAPAITESFPLSPSGPEPAPASASVLMPSITAAQEPRGTRKRKASAGDPNGNGQSEGSSIAERLKRQRRQPAAGLETPQPQVTHGARTSVSIAGGSLKSESKKVRQRNSKPPVTVSPEELQAARENREWASKVLENLTITGSKETGWPCTFGGCSKAMARRSDTLRHYKFVHLHWRDECSICPGLFSRPDGLQRHNKNYHSEPVARKKEQDEQEDEVD